MLISLVSMKGSPGTTTFAVALAARWPRTSRAIVVEADPAGGDLGVRFGLRRSPDLVTLAAAARQGASRDELWRHSQSLPGAVPVVIAPPDPAQARAALNALGPNPATGVGVLRAAAARPDVAVIADCGRLDPQSPAVAVARTSDIVVLVSRASADALAHLPRQLPSLGHWTAAPMLVLASEGYSSADVARELGIPTAGRIPHDPDGAAILSGRAPTRRWHRSGPWHSALAEFAQRIATDLASRGQSARDIREPASEVPGLPPTAVSHRGLRVVPAQGGAR